MTEPSEIRLPAVALHDADPHRLVDAIAEVITAGPRPDLLELAAELAAPPVDFLSTVFSARATMMAMSRGRAFYHHELRGRVPMPEALRPEVDVWDGGTVPQWTDGVFVEPKYFSFRQDAPFAAYNTVHRRKWRPHELLHGAVGFFWRPDATRFETYVGSRLNELLPVVHWYGLDEVFRPRCPAHRGTVLHREHCRDCERACRPFWEVEIDDADRAAAVRFVEEAQAHLNGELAACRDEIRTGRVHETPRGHLNASTDAVGYLLGHWNRLNAWSFRTWAEMFLRPGVDYHDDLADYADHIQACADQLVGGTVAVDRSRFEAMRQRRVLQDVAYRTVLALEWLEPGAEAALLDPLERCAAAAAQLHEAPSAAETTAADALDALLVALADLAGDLPEEVATPLLAFGLPFWSDGRDPDYELANLAEGIAQATPLAADLLDAEELRSFAASDLFGEPGRLATRFAAFLTGRASHVPELTATADLAALEAWIADDPHRDEEAERFAQPLSDLEVARPADVRLNRTARRAPFGAAAVAAYAEIEVDAPQVELLAAYWRGELQLVIVDAAVDAVLADVVAQRAPAAADTALALAEAGVIVWIPTVSQRGE